jgi:hypothetical protein
MARRWVEMISGATPRSIEVILGGNENLTGRASFNLNSADPGRISIEVYDRGLLIAQSKSPLTAESYTMSSMVFKGMYQDVGINMDIQIDVQRTLKGAKLVSALQESVTPVAYSLFLEVEQA